MKYNKPILTFFEESATARTTCISGSLANTLSYACDNGSVPSETGRCWYGSSARGIDLYGSACKAGDYAGKGCTSTGNSPELGWPELSAPICNYGGSVNS